MILLVLVLVTLIAMSGGVCVGYVLGRVHERAIAETRQPLAPHEALAELLALAHEAGHFQLRGPIGGGR